MTARPLGRLTRNDSNVYRLIPSSPGTDSWMCCMPQKCVLKHLLGGRDPANLSFGMIQIIPSVPGINYNPAGTLRYIYVVFMFGGYVEITFGFMLECLVLFT